MASRLIALNVCRNGDMAHVWQELDRIRASPGGGEEEFEPGERIFVIGSPDSGHERRHGRVVGPPKVGKIGKFLAILLDGKKKTSDIQIKYLKRFVSIEASLLGHIPSASRTETPSASGEAVTTEANNLAHKMEIIKGKM